MDDVVPVDNDKRGGLRLVENHMPVGVLASFAPLVCLLFQFLFVWRETEHRMNVPVRANESK